MIIMNFSPLQCKETRVNGKLALCETFATHFFFIGQISLTLKNHCFFSFLQRPKSVLRWTGRCRSLISKAKTLKDNSHSKLPFIKQLTKYGFLQLTLTTVLVLWQLFFWNFVQFHHLRICLRQGTFRKPGRPRCWVSVDSLIQMSVSTLRVFGFKP